MSIGVYEIVNVVNGLRYVGSSIDVKARLAKHKNELKKSVHHCKKLQAAYTALGADVWEFRLLKECGVDELRFVEQEEMDRTDSDLILNTFRKTVIQLPNTLLQSELTKQAWGDPVISSRMKAGMRKGWADKVWTEVDLAEHRSRADAARSKISLESIRANTTKARARRDELLASDVDGLFRKSMGVNSGNVKGSKGAEASSATWRLKMQDTEFSKQMKADRSAKMKAYRATPEGKAAHKRSLAAREANRRMKLEPLETSR